LRVSARVAFIFQHYIVSNTKNRFILEQEEMAIFGGLETKNSLSLAGRSRADDPVVF
jgi:hypothetical protein